MHIKELAPHMGPACGFIDLRAFEDGIEARIAIDVKNAFEVFEMGLRMFALAIR